MVALPELFALPLIHYFSAAPGISYQNDKQRWAINNADYSLDILDTSDTYPTIPHMVSDQRPPIFLVFRGAHGADRPTNRLLL